MCHALWPFGLTPGRAPPSFGLAGLSPALAALVCLDVRGAISVMALVPSRFDSVPSSAPSKRWSRQGLVMGIKKRRGPGAAQ